MVAGRKQSWYDDWKRRIRPCITREQEGSSHDTRNASAVTGSVWKSCGTSVESNLNRSSSSHKKKYTPCAFLDWPTFVHPLHRFFVRVKRKKKLVWLKHNKIPTSISGQALASDSVFSQLIHYRQIFMTPWTLITTSLKIITQPNTNKRFQTPSNKITRIWK
jgi:hypothetical protein